MWDRDVRAALHAFLQEEHAHERPTTRILDELGLAGEVRVDVAVLNGSFSGFEIKSERDTLKRLPKQAEVYSKILDYMTLVVADRHLDHALEQIPDWWAVITARATDSGVRLNHYRQGLPNPGVEAAFLATMLWRDELLTALEKQNLIKGFRSKPANTLRARLVEHVSAEEVAELVREQLKARTGWRMNAMDIGP